MTRTLHPPGGATALIAVTGSEKIRELGYWYVVSPVLTGCLVLFVVAFICNNMASGRTYPVNSKFVRRLKAGRGRGKRSFTGNSTAA